MFEVVQGRRIEYELIAAAAENADAGSRAGSRPRMVFLHEGLGSLAMWRDFPARCAAAAGCNALVYSRYGYGQSDPIDAPRRPDFMHDEALKTLPELLEKLNIERPILFGHSDGASIALIYAASHPVTGVIVLAPHLFVEPVAIQSIRGIKGVYEQTELRARLGKYHGNPDSAFRGWNDIWLHPDFLAWDITKEAGRIRAPILAVQGLEDEYGTMEQLHRLADLAPQTELLKLENCRHSPHRDQPEAVIRAVVAFVEGLDAAGRRSRFGAADHE